MGLPDAQDCSLFAVDSGELTRFRKGEEQNFGVVRQRFFETPSALTLWCENVRSIRFNTGRFNPGRLKVIRPKEKPFVLSLLGLILLCYLNVGWASLSANRQIVESITNETLAEPRSEAVVAGPVIEVAPDVLRKAGVPPALMPWVPWVLAETPNVNCPANASRLNSRHCQWATALNLQPRAVTPYGIVVEFNQQWRVFAPGWLMLPGGDLPNGETNWPAGSLLNGKPALAVRHANRPAVWVEAGQYRVEGRFIIRLDQPYFWIPEQTGLVNWQLDSKVPLKGLPEAFRAVFSKPPRVDAQGRLWLTPRRGGASPQENALNYQLFRRFKDGVPVIVDTRLNLSIGGKARAVRLPDMKLPNMMLISTNTELPYRWDGADLLLQVKPGQWSVQFRVRYTEPVTTVAVPSRTDEVNKPGPLGLTGVSQLASVARPSAVSKAQEMETVQPEQTLWVLAANPKYRALNTSGLMAIDPTQTALPKAWRADSVFLAEPGAVWTWSASELPVSTGQNNLRLKRDIWLDFVADGMTVQDKINGNIGDQWRLSVREPLNLGRVTVNKAPAVITVLSPEGGEANEDAATTKNMAGAQGVELRSGNVALEATGRFDDRQAMLPVTGWQTHFSDVDWQLHLPPAWGVLAVTGADRVRGTWWSHWRIWDVFWVALLVAAMYRLSNLPFAVLTGILLVLTYAAEFSLSPVVWALTIIVLALARSGIQAAWVRRITTISAVGVSVIWVVFLAPMLFGELKRFVFPEVFDDISWTSPQDTRMRAAMAGSDANSNKNVEGFGAPGQAAFHDQELEYIAENDFMVANQAPMRLEESVISLASEPQRQYSPKAIKKNLSQKSFQYSRRKKMAPAGVQTGPGAPDWHRQTGAVKLHWKGPVRADQQVRIYWAPPSLLRGLSALKLVLWPLVFLGLIYWLWQGNAMIKSFLKNMPIPAVFKRLPANTSAAASVLMFSLALIFLVQAPSVASAASTDNAVQAFPDADLLAALKSRLTQAPPCAPDCFAVELTEVRVVDDLLHISLMVNAQTPLFLPMPVAPPHWVPNRITVNREEAYAVSFAERLPHKQQRQTRASAVERGQQYILLPAGQQFVQLVGAVRAPRELQLSFPWHVQNLDIEAPEWQIQGQKGFGLINNTLMLKRKKVATTKEAQTDWLPQPAPQFVRLHRHFEFDHQLMLVNNIQRIAPKRGALAVEVPLLAGEAVLDEQLKVTDAGVVVNLAAGQNHFSWRSQILLPDLAEVASSTLSGEEAITETTAETDQGGPPNAFSPALTLSLQALAAPNIVETWQFSISEQWHLKFRDLTALPLSANGDQGGRWQPIFWPWAGESLQILGVKPAAVPGHNLTVDQASYQLSPGLRATEAKLTLSVSNSVASPLKILLPVGAYDVALQINGRALPVPEVTTALAEPDTAGGAGLKPVVLEPLLQPGKQNVLVNFQLPSGVSTQYRVPEITLPRPLVNFETRVNLPRDRWVLWLSGEGQGPRVTFWVALCLVLLVAPWIHQKSWIPLRGYEWVLLGLGFSLSFWPGLVGLVIWLIVLKAKPMWAVFIRTPRLYNCVQVGLFMLSLWVLISFIVAVPSSLLAHPRMAVTGQYWSSAFVWYQDRLGADFPSVAVWSLPLWVYRVAMLVWCLWLANRMVLWARWGWGQLALLGWFKAVPSKTKARVKSGATQSDSTHHKATGPEGASPE